ncbi:hypothetical protein C6P41_002972 [Kluyveromyces marxianus]|nr:hypothetical protein C6P41_002972 [Kluyveromyces marxianus]
MTFEEQSSTMVVSKPALLSDVRDQISGDMGESNGSSNTSVAVGSSGGNEKAELYPVISNDSSAGSSRKSGGSGSGNIDDSGKDIKPNNPASNPVCKNCYTSTTPLWRRDEHGSVLCNACGLFLKLHGRPRPISLKTDVIKSRNRKSTHHDSPNDKKKKDREPGSVAVNPAAKKRKTNDSPQYEQIQQLAGQLAKTVTSPTPNGNWQSQQPQQAQQVQQNIQSAESVDDIKYQKILPKNNQGKGNPLPHLSNILSTPSADYSTPNSPRLSSIQRQAPPLATINEILTNSRNQQGGNSTQLASINSISSNSNNCNNNVGHTEVNQKSLGQLSSIMNNQSLGNPSNGGRNNGNTSTLSPSLLNQQLSQPNQPSQQQQQQQALLQDKKPLHFSASPPSLEPQQTAAHSTTSSSNSVSFHHQQQQLKQEQQMNMVSDLTHSVNNISANGITTSSLHFPGSPVIKEEEKPSLSLILQSQEEVIKLKTRISELELVTDLYKRHVFELDSRCKALENELLAVQRQNQNK